jgi:tetratricopeptide (TPR) repeat protein
VADLLVTRGTALSSLGRALEGLGTIEAGRRLAAAEGLLDVEHRALLNMSGPLADRDPRAFLEASRASLELARREGSRPAAALAASNLAEAARTTGDWDLALAELRREAEMGAGDELRMVEEGLVLLEAERGEDRSAAAAALISNAESRVALGEPVWQTRLDVFRANLALPAGRYRDAAVGFLSAARRDAFNATNLFASASLASMLGRDAAGTEAALAGLEATGSHGRIVKLDRKRARAALASLAGRQAEALDGLREVLEDLHRLDVALPIAMTGLVMGTLLDPSDREVVAATDEARTIFERLGARAWLDRLDEAVRRAPGEPGTAPATHAPPAVVPSPASAS